MSKQETFGLLEDKMLKYADLVDIPVKPMNEEMVRVVERSGLRVNSIDPNMQPFTGEDIYLRRETFVQLSNAANMIRQILRPRLELEIVYGYRALSIQTKLYKKIKADLEDQYEGIDLMEAAHRMIAVPEVSGHPTGGAVDVQLTQDGEPIDFGTKIWEFTPDSYAFSPYVSNEAWNNRQLLRRVMTSAGFAPFDGEWWHFSFGDREWAKYYGEPAAVYEQIEFSS